MIKNFKIPLASYLELTKVIVAYSYFEPEDIIALNIVADKINKHPCAISRNNGFFFVALFRKTRYNVGSW